MVGGGRVYGGSNMSVLLQNDGISCSSESLDSILLSNSSPFHGSGSMVNFADVNGVNFTKRSFFQVVDNDENGEEDLDEYLRQPEKKRRLTTDQVEYLEKSFEVENKLEPDRKIQLAKDLGLQPRQVAIWFQNRRARWKTKQLEKDYEILKASYNSLKTNYENLIKEKEKLKTEVLTLTDKQLQNQKERGNSDPVNPNSPALVEPQNTISYSVSEEKPLEVSVVVCKQEISSTNSDIVDVDSPHYGHGVHSSLIIETANSSHVFEADQSETSQDEEDNFSQNLAAPFYSFPKLEDTDEPPANSCNYEFLAEDQPPPGWFWSY